MPAATKCSKALFWIASWSAATGASSTPCFCSAARNSVTLRSHTAAAVARCASSTRHEARRPVVSDGSFSFSFSFPPSPAVCFFVSSFSSKLASKICIAFTGSVAAPFTWSRRASTTPVRPSRNRSSSRCARRDRRVASERRRASAVSRARVRCSIAAARASAARARRCRTSSASRARASSSRRRCSTHTRAAATRVARRGPTATMNREAVSFSSRVSSVVRGAKRTSSAVSSYAQRHRPRRRTSFLPTRKRSRANGRAWFVSVASPASSCVFVSKHRYASPAATERNATCRPRTSTTTWFAAFASAPASESGSPAPGTSAKAGVNVTCSEVPAPAPGLPDVDARSAARSASAATSRRRGVPSEEQRTTTSPSRTSLRVEPGTSAREDFGRPRLRGRPTMFPIAGACVARAALRGAPIWHRSLLRLVLATVCAFGKRSVPFAGLVFGPASAVSHSYEQTVRRGDKPSREANSEPAFFLACSSQSRLRVPPHSHARGEPHARDPSRSPAFAPRRA